MGTELWRPGKPEPRERYDRVEEMSGTELEEATHGRREGFTQALEVYQEEQEARGSGSLPARFGQMLGDAFLRCYQCNVLQKADPQQLQRLRNQVIKVAASEGEGRAILSGAIAQLGTFEAMKEAIFHSKNDTVNQSRLYHSLPVEDLRGGTDFYLYYRPLKIALAVQLKSVPLVAESKNQIIYPIHSVEEVDGIVLSLVGDIENDSEKIRRKKCVELLGDARFSMTNMQENIISRYSNVVPCLMLVPGHESVGAQFTATGKPNQEFVERLDGLVTGLAERSNEYLPPPMDSLTD